MSIRSLMQPKSIAVLGASERPSIGRAVMDALAVLDFPGDIYPINPKYDRLFGRACYRSIAELPAPPDVVAFCVSSANAVQNIDECAKIGAGAAVIYDSGFAEEGEDGKLRQEKIKQTCREAGVSLCGPNGMGVLNVHGRSSTYIQEIADTSRLPGNVGLVSQSGSICVAMASDVRRFGFSYLASTGNEAVVSMAEYIEYLVNDPNTKVIAAFLESVRDPERLVASLDLAANAGKPVVVIKVGRSERTQHAVTTHTGGLAGEARVFSEVLRAHRAIEVRDLDEMTEVLAAAQSTKRPRGSDLGVVTSSGGKAELILDLADEADISLPALPEPELRAIREKIGSFAGDGNPLDAWGNGDFANNFRYALDLFGKSPNHHAVVLSADGADGNPMGHPERTLRYARAVAEAAAASEKPHYFMGMRSSVLEQSVVDFLKQHDVPVVGGTRQGLGAIAKLAHTDRQLPPVLDALSVVTPRPTDMGRKAINEFDSKRLLKAAGVPVCNERKVTTVAEAIEAAAAIGYPVVLKIVADDIPHKTEYGLVAVGLRSQSDLESAWRRLERALESCPPAAAERYFLVQEMISGGIEVFAGIKRDLAFGPVLAFGLGGIAIEVIDDVALRLLPLRQGDARDLVLGVRGAALLCGARAKTPFDVDALVACLEAFGQFAWSARDWIEEIDINPIIVQPEGQGCLAVDALIVQRN